MSDGPRPIKADPSKMIEQTDGPSSALIAAPLILAIILGLILAAWTITH